MKYLEIEFKMNPCTQDGQDILAAMAGEAGFESFEETATGLKAYIQRQLFQKEALDDVIAAFPFEGTEILYNVRETEDRDWNEQWEQEGFEPICIALPQGDGKLVIHDGRHLPAAGSQEAADIAIEIDAHLAFGTGTHETTRMICATLLEMDVKGCNVLDCGCGTGILGICALKLGASSCVGYDIDEWSTDNTRHNSIINLVDDRMTALCGDATLLASIGRQFDVVMANINRNILLNDMERFEQVMAAGATLILSGFYENDCPLLEKKARMLGLTPKDIRTDGEWACMMLEKAK